MRNYTVSGDRGGCCGHFFLHFFSCLVVAKCDLVQDVETCPTKKETQHKIFLLSFPFNAKMLIVIKYLVFDQILPKLECGIDEYLCFPRVGKKHIKTNSKQVLEVFIQWYCLGGIPSMLCNGKVRNRYGFVMRDIQCIY